VSEAEVSKSKRVRHTEVVWQAGVTRSGGRVLSQLAGSRNLHRPDTPTPDNKDPWKACVVLAAHNEPGRQVASLAEDHNHTRKQRRVHGPTELESAAAEANLSRVGKNQVMEPPRVGPGGQQKDGDFGFESALEPIGGPQLERQGVLSQCPEIPRRKSVGRNSPIKTRR
jgi:hypothetical protein